MSDTALNLTEVFAFDIFECNSFTLLHLNYYIIIFYGT